jgi:hypothetical protein
MCSTTLFDSRLGQVKVFVFSITSRPILEPTQYPVQWVRGRALFLETKGPAGDSGCSAFKHKIQLLLCEYHCEGNFVGEDDTRMEKIIY